MPHCGPSMIPKRRDHLQTWSAHAEQLLAFSMKVCRVVVVRGVVDHRYGDPTRCPFSDALALLLPLAEAHPNNTDVLVEIACANLKRGDALAAFYTFQQVRNGDGYVFY